MYVKSGLSYIRAVGRSENPGVPVLFGGNNVPPLAEIGFTSLPKSVGAMAPLAPLGTTGLPIYCYFFSVFILILNSCFLIGKEKDEVSLLIHSITMVCRASKAITTQEFLHFVAYEPAIFTFKLLTWKEVFLDHLPTLPCKRSL